ncbi:unnamed protein product [Ectocarpus sp. CCAP 1310/34]|nr:unnamed protein product [Ectocarpus sp. CCAP 1310/34]
MPPPLPTQGWPRGPMNELHLAAMNGSSERALALLSSRDPIDVNQGDSAGCTPLMLATTNGHPRVVRILLNHGANMSIVDDVGSDALLKSAVVGHSAVTKMLVKASANLEAADFDGATPLHLAATCGNSEVMRVLIEAGAEVDSRMTTGSTPLCTAASFGHTSAVIRLIHANADPLLGNVLPTINRRSRLGIERCGGESRGVDALCLAVKGRHVGIVAMLAHAGVVDKGSALAAAAAQGYEASVKFLLRQHEGKPSGSGSAYVNKFNRFGLTPLLENINCGHCSARIVRLLVDAGADTTAAFRLTGKKGQAIAATTQLTAMECLVLEKRAKGDTGEQRHNLQATFRLLLQVEAAHAISWVWPTGSHSVDRPPRGQSRAEAPVRLTLPMTRRDTGTRRALLGAMSRYSGKSMYSQGGGGKQQKDPSWSVRAVALALVRGNTGLSFILGVEFVFVLMFGAIAAGWHGTVQALFAKEWLVFLSVLIWAW